MNSPRSRNAIEFQDVVPATFVVGNDLQTADFLTLAEAIVNLPDDSRSIYCLTPEVISSTIVMPDKDTSISWATEAVFTYSGVPVLFQIPNGLTDFRRYSFIGGSFDGGGAVGQTLIQISDANSRGLPYFFNCKVRGTRIAVDITAGDITYAYPVYVRFVGGSIISPNNASPLFKSPSAAGTYDFGMSIQLNGTVLDDENGNGAVPSWTLDFDGEIIGTDIFGLALGGVSAVDGLQLFGVTGIRGGGNSLRVYASSYWAEEGGRITMGGCTLIADRGDWHLFLNDSTIQVNGDYVEVEILRHYSVGAAVCVDILTGADHVIVSGRFVDHATAAIRTDAKYGSFVGCRFGATGAHKTILETANADFNISTGATALSSGGGVTVVGANSLYDTTLANVA